MWGYSRGCCDNRPTLSYREGCGVCVTHVAGGRGAENEQHRCKVCKYGAEGYDTLLLLYLGQDNGHARRSN